MILLDVMMPGLDGWRVAEQLVDDSTTRRIPIIFFTTRVELWDRARDLDIGGVDYLVKPFNPVDLAPLVRNLIPASRPRRAMRASPGRDPDQELETIDESCDGRRLEPAVRYKAICRPSLARRRF